MELTILVSCPMIFFDKGKSAELKKVLQASQQQLECQVLPKASVNNSNEKLQNTNVLTQVDLSIPLDMINKLAGEVRGMKEEQLQRWSNPRSDYIANNDHNIGQISDQIILQIMITILGCSLNICQV